MDLVCLGDTRNHSSPLLTNNVPANETPLRLSALGKHDFDALFRQHYAALVLYGLKFLRDREQSKEVVQEIFIALYERRGELVIRSNPKSYLFQSVRNRCLNELEKMKTKNKRLEALRQEAVDSYMFSDPLEAAEFEAKLHSLIQGLPPACRSVFQMSRFDGKSNSEIAENLKISKRTVETQISKALRILRQAVYGKEGKSNINHALRSFLL